MEKISKKISKKIKEALKDEEEVSYVVLATKKDSHELCMNASGDVRKIAASIATFLAKQERIKHMVLEIFEKEKNENLK